MAQLKFPIRVYYEDGSTVEVEVGQRDIAAWERSNAYVADRSTLRIRYMAFAALRRAGLLPKTPGGTPIGHEGWEAIAESIEDVSDEQDTDPTPPPASPED